MSTPNFSHVNTNNIYTINNCLDFAQYDCQTCLESFDWELCDEYDKLSNRNYPATIIGEKTKCIYVGGASIDIKAQAKIVSGYYNGACFDFDCCVSVYDYDGYNVNNYECIADIDEYIDIDTIKNDNWTGFKGLSTIHASHIYKAMQQAVDALKNEAEKAFSNSCDNQLTCVTIFNNGEAIYKRV